MHLRVHEGIRNLASCAQVQHGALAVQGFLGPGLMLVSVKCDEMPWFWKAGGVMRYPDPG